RHPRGNLLLLSSLFYRQAKVAGYGRACGALPPGVPEGGAGEEVRAWSRIFADQNKVLSPRLGGGFVLHNRTRRNEVPNQAASQRCSRWRRHRPSPVPIESAIVPQAAEDATNGQMVPGSAIKWLPGMKSRAALMVRARQNSMGQVKAQRSRSIPRYSSQATKTASPRFFR